MKFVLAALTALLATAAAAVPEISANSALGKNLLHHARRLDGEEQEDEEEYSWVSGYALKFVRKEE